MVCEILLFFVFWVGIGESRSEVKGVCRGGSRGFGDVIWAPETLFFLTLWFFQGFTNFICLCLQFVTLSYENIGTSLLHLSGLILMASQYIAHTAPIPIDPSIPQFFEKFYRISDTPDAHSEYVDSFTDDATMIMASKKGVGKEGSSSCPVFL